MARPTARLGSSLTHARGATKPLPVRWRSRHIAADCMEIVSTCGAMWRHRCALLAGPTTMRGYAASPTCPTNGSRSALFGSGLTSNRCQMLRWPGLMPSTVCCAARPGGRATPTTLLFARLFDPRPPHEEGNMLSNLGLEASRSGTRLAPLYAAYLLLFPFKNRGHCLSVRYAY